MRMQRERYIMAHVFWQEIRGLAGPFFAPPTPSTVLDALNTVLDAGYDIRHWEEQLTRWAVRRGWPVTDARAQRARFRAQLIQEIDAVFERQTSQTWPPSALTPLPPPLLASGGEWAWRGLYGWGGKTIEEWDSARTIAEMDLGFTTSGSVDVRAAARFERRTIGKMLLDRANFRAQATQRDYELAVAAVMDHNDLDALDQSIADAVRVHSSGL